MTVGLLSASIVAAGAAPAPDAAPSDAARLDSAFMDAVPKAPVTPLDPAAIDPSAVDTGSAESLGKLSVRARELLAGHRRQAVFVELAGPGAATAARSAAADSRRAAGLRRAEIGADVDEVRAAVTAVDGGSTEIFRVANAAAGVGMTVDAKGLEALAARDDVVRVSPLTPKTRSTAGAASLTRTVQAWQRAGLTGKGVRIGVIDTGIDYTHADFGGPGTREAFEAAEATSTKAWTPTAVVAGGYDFAGDDYDATDNPFTSPDPNPLDCQGHGSHVAGIAAGRGVTTDGATYTGSYQGLDDTALRSMKIAPGLAPEATLYALRVFGCDGSTNLLIPALDWALDPDRDGSFDDHLDIVNISLGSQYGTFDDPESAYVDKVAALGVVPVVSAGNEGDVTGIGSSPATAERSIAVANEVDALLPMDGVQVDAPAGQAGVVPGQMSEGYPWQESADVSGQVAVLSAANRDGCSPLSTADTSAVAGKVAFTEWVDDSARRRCGTALRSQNLAAAGAIGVLITNDVPAFTSGIAGIASLPVVQLTKSASDALRPAARAGTLRVTFRGSLAVSVVEEQPERADTIESDSSRMGGTATVKPDLAAPGDTILSAAVGGGSIGSVKTGTSMAAPATAGAAALVLQKHDGYSVEQVKAALMNTAVRDVTVKNNHQGAVYGPARVGAGALDTEYAARTSTLVYNADGSGAVGLGFGTIAAPVDGGAVRRSQRVTVQNTSSKARSYTLSYRSATEQSGVSYAISPSRVQVAAGGTATVTVTATVDPRRLRRTIEPTMTVTQQNPVFADAAGRPRVEPRNFVPAASGRLLVDDGADVPLRVPVHASAKPVSTTSSSVSGATASGGTIVQKGAGVVLDRRGNGHRYQSRLSVLTLGQESPRQEPCTEFAVQDCLAYPSEAAADLRYVGAGAVPAGPGTVPQLWFGISTWGRWPQLSEARSQPTIAIDKTGDGQADNYVLVQPLEGTDLVYGLLTDADQNVIGGQPVNLRPADEDTNVFDTDTVLVGVSAAQLGMKPGATSFPITYSVLMFDGSGLQDDTDPVSFDVARPDVRVDRALYADVDGARVDYRVQAPKGRPVQALVLHSYGADGRRAEVVTLRP